MKVAYVRTIWSLQCVLKQIFPFTVDRTQHDQLAATVNQLEADNAELTDENRRMAEAASERETIVHELEEEAGSLHTRWENRLRSRLDCVLVEVAGWFVTSYVNVRQWYLESVK